MSKHASLVKQSGLSGLLNSPPTIVAKDLLGCLLYSVSPSGQKVGGIICETEAYLSTGDLAAHNARGKTNANKSLFSEAGTLYIHQMRQHVLMDIVTEGPDMPGSVLIRALEPKFGISIMQERRGTDDLYQLCRGPGNLCKALGVDKTFDGQNILDKSSCIIVEPDNLGATAVSVSGRIGISKNADAPLRFFLEGSAFTSAKR